MADEERDKVYSWDFRKFIERTPCARDALIYGIVGGLGIGLVSFLRSNYTYQLTRILSALGHVRRSCDIAVGSFAVISIGGWELCRYTRHKEKEQIKKTVDMLNEYSKMKREEKTDEPSQT